MTAFWEMLSEGNRLLNTFIWDSAGLWILMGTGILLSCRTGFFQIVRLRHWMGHTAGSLLRKNTSVAGGAITQFQALCTALAATVGVGNIVGVAAAITAGGPGAIFWMWVAALFGMMTGYSEKVLGIYYRRRVDGEWAGGPMYYLRDGLGRKHGCRMIGRMLAGAFAVCTVLASFGIGNMGQVNKIVAHWEQAIPIPALSGVILYKGVSLYSLLIGLILLLAGAAVIFGGLQGIARMSERLVPAMIVLFIGGSLAIIVANASRIDDAVVAIFRGAFRPDAVWGGAVGITLRQAVTLGFKRGMFSNEAGLGSSVMIHASADVREPVQQGMWGIFEVFADTIVVCTMTALVILTGGGIDLATGALAPDVLPDGTDLVAAAFRRLFGPVGNLFVSIAILLFAFTTLLGWSQYGVRAVEYLGGKRAVVRYRVIYVLLIPAGALLASGLVWDISDTFNGLMMIPNLIGILALSGQVKTITDNYIDRHLRHKAVPPLLSYDTRIQKRMESQN